MKNFLRFLLFVAFSFFVAEAKVHSHKRDSHSLPVAPGPAQQCGWPYLFESHVNTPAIVRFCQLLLRHWSPNRYGQLPVDGMYGDETKAAVIDFQQTFRLKYTDGHMGVSTWPALVATASPLQPATGAITSGGGFLNQTEAVLALQESLSFQGFWPKYPSPPPFSGIFDSTTIKALQRFQTERKDPTSNGNGTLVTNSTWHLLISGCNVSGGAYWFDAGWPQGLLSSSALSCLHDQYSFQFATFECWVEGGGDEDPLGSFWADCPKNIINAWSAGFESVGVYMFPQRDSTQPGLQAEMLLQNLTLNGLTYPHNFSSVMLDIEGPKWLSYSQEENQKFILALKDVFVAKHGILLTVYCGAEWPTFFGRNFTEFKEFPLIYAHYDNVPNYYDWWPSYGGWSQPSGKQFWDGSNGEQVCGANLDWDWSAKPFWNKRT